MVVALEAVHSPYRMSWMAPLWSAASLCRKVACINIAIWPHRASLSQPRVGTVRLHMFFAVVREICVFCLCWWAAWGSRNFGTLDLESRLAIAWLARLE